MEIDFQNKYQDGDKKYDKCIHFSVIKIFIIILNIC